MRRFSLFFLLLCTVITEAQTISGIVVDEQNQPLPGATIYFDGTSFGTSSDSNGNFNLTIPSKISATLIVSFVGYEALYLDQYKFDTFYTFKMRESTAMLKEVVLTNHNFSRKMMLNVFYHLFIGKTSAGKKCTIENEDSIYFTYDNNTLRAYADVPIIINNPVLGYKVFYTLANFETKFYKRSVDLEAMTSCSYSGTSRFEEMYSNATVIKNREKAFEGSTLELFRTLHNNSWSKKSFTLFSNGFERDATEYFVPKDTIGLKKIQVKQNLSGIFDNKLKGAYSVLYNRKVQSKIMFYTDSFFIDAFGLYTNFDQIHFIGEITKKKVGDLLPANYGIE